METLLTKKGRAKGMRPKVHFFFIFRGKMITYGQSAIYLGAMLSFSPGLFGTFQGSKLSRGCVKLDGKRCAAPQRRRGTKNFLEENFSIIGHGGQFYFLFFFFIFLTFFVKNGQIFLWRQRG